MVVMDQTMYIPSSTFAAGVQTNPGFGDPLRSLLIDKYIKLKNLETQYKADAGTVGDIASGGLFMFIATNNGDQKYTCACSIRIRYDDM